LNFLDHSVTHDFDIFNDKNTIDPALSLINWNQNQIQAILSSPHYDRRRFESGEPVPLKILKPSAAQVAFMLIQFQTRAIVPLHIQYVLSLYLFFCLAATCGGKTAGRNITQYIK
jgi:hypothetical protein